MLRFARFIGANTDFSTAQAYLFPRVYVEGSQEPVFGLVISGQGEDIFVKIRQKILNLEEAFLESQERISDKLHNLAERLKTEFAQVEDLKFSLFCAKDNIFYVLSLGNNLIEVFREGSNFPVLTGNLSQGKVVSGFIKAGDKILILSAKSGDQNWGEEVLAQVFALSGEAIDDAELIFASDELKAEKQEDLAGVKEIKPVAFILIENQIVEKVAANEKTISSRSKLPEINLLKKLPSFDIKLFLHRIIRRLLGFLRSIDRRLLIGLAVLTLLLVLASAGYGFLKNRENTRNKRVENLITSVQSHLSKAVSFKDSDPKTAKDELNQAKSQLDELTSLDPKNSVVAEIKKDQAQKEAEILKIYQDFDLELFLSLDLIKSSYQTDRMSFSVDKILLLDNKEKSLVAIDTKLKTPNILAGPPQLGDAKIASLNGSDAFVYSSDKGLVHVNSDTKKASVVSSLDSEWGVIRDIFGFSSNLYALDSGKNMIWKYTPIEKGYSSKIEYLRGSNDLSQAKQLRIDYSVWILTSKPDILKFTAGNSDFYAVSGLDSPLTQIDGIYVTEELDSVFILDKSNNRILVTKKNGEYLAQYIKPEFSKVDDFFVDEEGKEIYLLIENKIFKTPLR